MKVTPWITDQLDSVAALAAARIQINNATPIGEETFIDKADPDNTVKVITLAVSYEFQWKHRGSYTWERMVGFYHATVPGPTYVSESLMPDEDHPISEVSDWGMQYSIYQDVIRAREQLEDPSDRGEYTYYLDPFKG